MDPHLSWGADSGKVHSFSLAGTSAPFLPSSLARFLLDRPIAWFVETLQGESGVYLWTPVRW